MIRKMLLAALPVLALLAIPLLLRPGAGSSSAVVPETEAEKGNPPAEEVEKAIAFVESLDIREIAQQVMEKLLKDLQMRYDFTLPEASDAQNAK